jgi:hypothetical protein
MQMSHPCNNLTNKRRWIGDYRIGVESTVWSSYQSTWIQWQDVGTLYLASDTSHPFDDDFKLEMRKKEKRHIHTHTHEAYRPGPTCKKETVTMTTLFLGFCSTLSGHSTWASNCSLFTRSIETISFKKFQRKINWFGCRPHWEVLAYRFGYLVIHLFLLQN